MKRFTGLFLALALAAPAAAQAPQTPAPAGDPCVLTPEESALRIRMELAMVDPPASPVLIDPFTGARLTGCSVWRVNIDASGQVNSVTYLRGRTSGDYIPQAQVWMRRLRFLQFSEGWSGIYLLRAG